MKKYLGRLSLLAALIAAGWSTAAADPIDASTTSTFELGKAYSIASFKSFKGTIDLPAGNVFVYNMPDGILSKDEAAEQSLDAAFQGYGTLISDDGTECNGQIYKYAVPEAGTYYFSCGFAWNDYTFGLQTEGAQDIAYTEISPAENSVITATVNSSGSGYLFINFNVPVKYSTAHIKCGEVTSATVKPPVSGYVTNVNVLLSGLMSAMYADGTFSEEGNTPFQVVIEGIEDESGNQYGADGTLTLNYVAGPALMKLLNSSLNGQAINGQEFLSYWPAGSDETAPGVYVFTFDHNLDTAPTEEMSPALEIGCGDIESENGYFFERVLPTSITNDGSNGKLVFDLRGTNRKAALEAIGSNAYDGAPVSVKLCNVRDINGNLPEPVTTGGGVTNVGSYSYTMALKFVPEQTIDYEFTPGNGGTLATCDNIELWHNNASVIQSFDGILFTYDDETSYLVPAADLVNESTEEGEALYHVAVPARAKTEGVTVSMSNIVALDGYEKNISASYNKFVITYSAPFAEGKSYAEVPADPWLIGDDSMTDNDKLIHARTNYADSYPNLFMKYSIEDVTDALNVKTLHTSDMKRLDSGEYVGCAMNHAEPLYAGHTYTITFSAWATEADYYNNAASLGSQSIKFYGTCEPFIYSDVVFVSITPNPNDGAITPSQNTFVVTYDGIVKPNEYTGVPAGMGMGLKPVTCEALNADPDNGGYASEWKITVPESYMTGTALDLNVGAVDINGLTVNGDIHSDSAAEYKSFSYAISNASGYDALTSTPANGATVTEISEIKLTADAPLGINWNYTGEGIQIYNKVSEIVRTLVCSDDDANEVFVESEQLTDESGNPKTDELGYPIYSENTYVVLRLKQPITDLGGYMVSIPEAYFTTGEQYTTNYNQATNITLTVGTEPASGLKLSIEPGNDETVESIAKILINTTADIYNDCPDYYMTLKRDEFYDVAEWSYSMVANEDGHIAKVYETPYDDSTPLVGYEFYIGSLEETPGTYTLTVPAKFFVKDGVYNDLTVISFMIASGEGVTLTTMPEDGATIKKGEFNEFFIYTDAEADETYDMPVTFENYDDFDAFQEAYGSDLEQVEGGYRIEITNDLLKNLLGIVHVQIPNGLFKSGSSKNDDKFLQLHIVESSGIAAVLGEDAEIYEVYTLQGVKVMATKDVKALSALGAGAYIINGKTFIIR